MRTRVVVTPVLVGLAMLAVGACSDDTVERIADPPGATTTVPGTGTGTAAPSTTNAAVPSTTVARPTTTARGPSATLTEGGTKVPASTSAVTTSRVAPLFGVPLRTNTDTAFKTLAEALGSPSSDSGWAIGCPLDDPVVENERVVTWGRLRVQFRRETETAPGALDSYGFLLPEGERLAATDPAAHLVLPDGITLGMPIGSAATALGVKAEASDASGWSSVTTPGVTFTADGTDPTRAKLNQVGVPHVPQCD